MKTYLAFLFCCIMLTACTISFQVTSNTNVGGETSDLVDDTQSPTNDVKPDINFSMPIKPL